MSRIESDFLGEREVPDDCYYGVQTLRGEDNFHITEMPMSQEPDTGAARAQGNKRHRHMEKCAQGG